MYAKALIAKATACEAMCKPSASSAMEPKTIPAAISMTIIEAVIAMTIRVLASPGFLESCPNVCEWM